MRERERRQLSVRQIREAVERALAEDLGLGDITTECTVPAGRPGEAVILAKEEGTIAGLEVARETFLAVDGGLEIVPLAGDGAPVKPGARLATIKGSLASILKAERTALNFLMRMSGIATGTARFVKAVEGTKAKIVDTRKTAPGLRVLDKYAVMLGGGANHRMGLFDGVLIKENHIASVGSIGEAVKKAKAVCHHLVKVEVETTSLEEVKEALEAGAEAILLDNMKPGMMSECVKLIAGRAVVEASGGITLENVREVAETGVDLISVGALTHSAKALDICLEVIAETPRESAGEASWL